MWDVERRTILKQVSVGIATAGSVSLAGCSGGGDEPAEEDEDDEPADGDAETTERDGGSETTESSDDEPDSSSEETDTGASTEMGSMVDWSEPAYEFTAGQSYTYDSDFLGTTGEQSWEVRSVDGDELTIRRGYPTEEGQETVDVTAPSDRIYEAIVTTISQQSFFRNLRWGQRYAELDEFEPGNTFTVDTSEREDNYDSETVEVMGETTVNGIQCTEFRVESNSGGIVTTACAAEGFPFPLSHTLEQVGTQLLDATLVDTTQS